MERKVDLQTANFLSPEIRQSALAEAVTAYEQTWPRDRFSPDSDPRQRSSGADTKQNTHRPGSRQLLNLALARLVEIIGEAANRIPEEVRAEYPELPWLQMIGARNRLIHGYDSVDFDILWVIVSHDLPILTRQLENILEVS